MNKRQEGKNWGEKFIIKVVFGGKKEVIVLSESTISKTHGS